MEKQYFIVMRRPSRGLGTIGRAVAAYSLLVEHRVYSEREIDALVEELKQFKEDISRSLGKTEDFYIGRLPPPVGDPLNEDVFIGIGDHVLHGIRVKTKESGMPL